MRIHKEGQGLSTLLAVLLFLAACAYLGAAVYRALCPEVSTATAHHALFRERVGLRGIAIREEELLFSPQDPSALPEDGTRLAAGETLCCFADGSSQTLSASSLFFAGQDGYEYLQPDWLFPFEPARAQALLLAEARDEPNCLGRAVRGQVWYFAAVLTEGECPPLGSRCPVYFGADKLEAEALVAALCREDGQSYLLLRFTAGDPAFFRLRHEEAELILAEHRGLQVPLQAIRQDEAGNHCLEIFSAGLVETRTVDILYRGDEVCLVRQRAGEAPLPAPCSVLLQKEGPDS